MKRKMMNFRKMMIGLVGLTLSVSLMAQNGNGPRHFNADRQGTGYFCHAVPDLTAEQEQQMGELRTMHLKEMNNFRIDLKIKQAELQKLQTADKVDMDKINAKIDEIGIIKVQMAKKRAAHIQKIRALLTDDQKVFFDSRHHKKGPGMTVGKADGRGPHGGIGPNCSRCDF
jgi:Spy/CpxP family protein refolding chaperone